MPLFVSFIGALVLTYALSRLLQIPLGRQRLVPLVASHLGSLILLFLFVGFLKAYWVDFYFKAGMIYVIPQLLWLGVDVLRRSKR